MDVSIGVECPWHADPQAAKENATRLKAQIDNGTSYIAKRPWSSFFDGSDITVDGNVLIARLRTHGANVLIGALDFGDTLILHE